MHKFGHGISYTETKLIEDKWAEWSEQLSSLLPSNIEKKGFITTLVFDNIDWKNKDYTGKETHNTTYTHNTTIHPSLHQLQKLVSFTLLLTGLSKFQRSLKWKKCL